MADLPGHSVAITSMCTVKLEHFAKIGTGGKRNFGNQFLRWFSFFGRNNYLVMKLDRQVFREITAHSLLGSNLQTNSLLACRQQI